MTTIQLTLPSSTPDLVIVRAWLSESLRLDMMLDTGSRYALIKPSAARQSGLDLDDAPVQAFATGSGLIRGRLVTLPQVTISGVHFADIPAAVVSLSRHLPSGVLGLSFLHRCRLLLDFPARVLELSAAADRKQAATSD